MQSRQTAKPYLQTKANMADKDRRIFKPTEKDSNLEAAGEIKRTLGPKLARQGLQVVDVIPLGGKALNTRLLDDKFMDWNTDIAAIYQGIEDVFNEKGGRIFEATGQLAKSREDEIWTKALNNIADEPNLQDPKQVARWAFHFTAVSVSHDLALETDLDQKSTKPTPEFVEAELDKKTQSFIDLVKKLEAETNVVNFIKFADYYFTSRDKIAKLPERKARQKNKKVTQNPNEVLKAAERFNIIGDQIKSSWDALSQNWTWSQIEEVVTILKDLQDDVSITSTIAAIELNLRNIPQSAISVDSPNEEIIYLDDFCWSDALDYEYRLPEGFIEYVETSIDFEGFSVPRKHLPSLLISYLQKFAGKESEFSEFLQNQDVGKNPARQTNWLITLMVLKNQNENVSLAFENFVKSSNFDTRTQDVLLDKIPGKVWLTKGKRLKVTTPGETFKEGFPVYTSKVQMPEVEKPKQIAQNQIEAQTIISYDFLGDVGIAKDEDTISFLGTVQNSFVADKDELEIEFLELSEGLKLKDQRTKIFIQNLNRGNNALRRARQIGIDSVVISGPAVTFVLNKDVLYTMQEQRKTPLAFAGILEDDGNLILDTEIPNLDETLRLYLNNIALELARVNVQAPESEETTKEIVTAWNTKDRGILPRLSAKPNLRSEIQIAVREDNQTTFLTQA